MLKPFPSNSGYQMVMFGLRGPKFYVHRLVANAFLGERIGDWQVNHKDGDKVNNVVANLEWVTASENQLHSTHVLGNRAGQFGPGGCRADAGS